MNTFALEHKRQQAIGGIPSLFWHTHSLRTADENLCYANNMKDFIDAVY